MENTNKRFLKNYPDVLTPKDLMEFLGVCESTVYDLLKRGVIKSIKIGKKYLIPKLSVENFMTGFDMRNYF